MEGTDFPVVRWDTRTVSFDPQPDGPARDDRAVIVFARCGDGYALADIPGRGWTVPGGRIEPGETPLQAAVRETREEVGGALEGARAIGRYVLTDDDGDSFTVPAFVGRVRAIGAIPPGSESRGARCVSPADLPGCYYTWDRLLERMFDYASRCLENGKEYEIDGAA